MTSTALGDYGNLKHQGLWLISVGEWYRVVLMSSALEFGYLSELSHRLLAEISFFVQKEATRGFLNLLFTKDQRISQIQEYHQRIGTSVTSFQVSHHIFSLRRFFALTNRTDIRIIEYSSLAIKE